MNLKASTRLGIDPVGRDMRNMYGPVLRRCRDRKRYELKNHLGNVLAVITDRKLAQGRGGNQVSYFKAQTIVGADYFPYGQLHPGRYVDLRYYRYGYNGKEREERGEFGTLTHYDYGFRVYSPSLGRFWSVDPKAAEYAGWSGYVYVMGNPLRYVDVEGMDPEDWYEDEKGNVVYNPKIKSQADLDAAGIKGKYLGRMGYGIDEKTGNKVFYSPIGYKVYSTFSLPEVVVTPKKDYIKPMVSYTIDAVGGLGTGLKEFDNAYILSTTMNWSVENKLTEKRIDALLTIGKMRRYGKAMRLTGSAGSFSLGLYEIGLYLNYEGEFGPYTQRAAGRATGSFIGSYSGALLGASIGGWFGGFGAIPGGIIGGIIGDYYGSKLGEQTIIQIQEYHKRTNLLTKTK